VERNAQEIRGLKEIIFPKGRKFLERDWDIFYTRFLQVIIKRFIHFHQGTIVGG